MTPAVQVLREGPVTTVILHRPDRRNAVDGPTAVALREAFTDFEGDPTARVAVLWGAGGHFCAGADLQAIAAGDLPALAPDGRGNTPFFHLNSQAARSAARPTPWCELEGRCL